MTTETCLVKDWMHKFGQECPSKPTIPSLEIRKLRAKLILEEALETITALGVAVDLDELLLFNNIKLVEYGEPNLTAIADGCADLKVVTLGTELACGIDGEKVFQEVMRSNDSKLWTYNELKSIKPNHDAVCVNCGDVVQCDCDFNLKCILVKDKDGKVIKSPSYSPANIQPILDAQS